MCSLSIFRSESIPFDIFVFNVRYQIKIIRKVSLISILNRSISILFKDQNCNLLMQENSMYLFIIIL